MNFETLKNTIMNDPVLLNSAIAFILVYAVINYIFLMKKLRKRNAEREAQAKADRIDKYKQEIQSQAAEQVAEQKRLEDSLLTMDEEAFNRYLRQEGYDQRIHLDVSFGKNDNPKFAMFHRIKSQRELRQYEQLLTKLQSDQITQMNDDQLYSIEQKCPHGNRFQLKDNPSELDRLKSRIGELAASELKRRQNIH